VNKRKSFDEDNDEDGNHIHSEKKLHQDDAIAKLKEQHRKELEQQRLELMPQSFSGTDKDGKERIKEFFKDLDKDHQAEIEEVKAKHREELSRIKKENGQLKQRLKELDVDSLVMYQAEKNATEYYKARNQLRQITKAGASVTEERRQQVLEEENVKYEEMGAAMVAQLQLQQVLCHRDKCKAREKIEVLTRDKESLAKQYARVKIEVLTRDKESLAKQLTPAKANEHLSQNDGNNYAHPAQDSQLHQQLQRKQQEINHMQQLLTHAHSTVVDNVVAPHTTDHETQTQTQQTGMKEKHDKEIQKLHIERLQEMKGANHRMEHLGTTIKQLSTQNREKDELIACLKDQLKEATAVSAHSATASRCSDVEEMHQKIAASMGTPKSKSPQHETVHLDIWDDDPYLFPPLDTESVAEENIHHGGGYDSVLKGAVSAATSAPESPQVPEGNSFNPVDGIHSPPRGSRARGLNSPLAEVEKGAPPGPETPFLSNEQRQSEYQHFAPWGRL
jgi:hypothetical protein